jgi:hypothetical protein
MTHFSHILPFYFSAHFIWFHNFLSLSECFCSGLEQFFTIFSQHWGHAVARLVEALRYKPEGRGFASRYHWNLSLTYSFRPHYGPVVDSSSNRNE